MLLKSQEEKKKGYESEKALKKWLNIFCMCQKLNVQIQEAE